MSRGLFFDSPFRINNVINHAISMKVLFQRCCDNAFVASVEVNKIKLKNVCISITIL